MTMLENATATGIQPRFGTEGTSRRGIVWRAFWPIALVGTIVFASSHQVASLPSQFDGTDKLVHFLVFGLLATHIIRLPSTLHRRLSLLQLWIAVASTTLFGLTDEVHQAFNPYRTFDYTDLLADFSGALVASLCYQKLTFYRQLLEQPLIRKRHALV